jgi:glutamate carboxypeptidase
MLDLAALRSVQKYLTRRKPAMLALLRRLVEMESPSLDKAAVDRLGAYVARCWRQQGARVEIVRQRERGNQVRAELALGQAAEAKKVRPAGQPRPRRDQILVLGHLDTVYPLGTLRKMPFRVRGNRAYGPGTMDMKAGIVIALFAVEALRKFRPNVARRVVFLSTGDEEIGSGSSRKLIEAEARKSAAVLVMEPANGLAGQLKTARKGVGEFEVHITGRAAHAGADIEKGRNAVVELAKQIGKMERFTEPARGITVNVGVISGGTRSNVVPAEAVARVDVRIARLADRERIERKFRALRPTAPDLQLEVKGGLNRPPLERTAGVAKLFRLAQQLGACMGLQLEEASVGGASDGNFTAALGIPTLDGLGGVGDNAHSPDEFVVMDSLPKRAALVAGLLPSI